MRSTRLLGLMAVFVVVLSACGGGAAEGTKSDTTTSAAPEQSSTSTAPATPTTTESSGAASDAAHATVTIGDATYEFVDTDGIWTCGNLAGTPYGNWALDADGSPVLAGGTDAALTLIFTLSPVDWETQGLPEPSVAIQEASSGAQWWAGAVRQVSTDSHLDTWTVDGGHGVGDATFIDIGAYYRDNSTDLVEGSFDITCP